MHEVLLTLWFDSPTARSRLASALPGAPVAPDRRRARAGRWALRRRPG
jgi:hypothetical protein